jgi:hypothetical protein
MEARIWGSAAPKPITDVQAKTQVTSSKPRHGGKMSLIDIMGTANIRALVINGFLRKSTVS